MVNLSAPVLRAVPDVQDFDNFFSGAVHNDVRRADKFAGSFHHCCPLQDAKYRREGSMAWVHEPRPKKGDRQPFFDSDISDDKKASESKKGVSPFSRHRLKPMLQPRTG
jgi:hypothetical protein